jgi:LSD1 subclass zinc finger protein
MIVSCPSCGNKIDVMPGAVEVVCPYCNTIILIQREQIVSLGKQAPIVPFPTTFSVGKNFYAVEDEGSNDILANKKVSWYSEEDFYKNKFDNYLVKVYIS